MIEVRGTSLEFGNGWTLASSPAKNDSSPAKSFSTRIRDLDRSERTYHTKHCYFLCPSLIPLYLGVIFPSRGGSLRLRVEL